MELGTEQGYHRYHRQYDQRSRVQEEQQEDDERVTRKLTYDLNNEENREMFIQRGKLINLIKVTTQKMNLVKKLHKERKAAWEQINNNGALNKEEKQLIYSRLNDIRDELMLMPSFEDLKYTRKEASQEADDYATRLLENSTR